MPLEAFKNQLQELMPEEIETLIEQYASQLDDAFDKISNLEELMRAFEYLQVLLYNQEMARVRGLLPDVGKALDPLLEANPDDETLLLLAIEWEFLAEAMVISSPDHFVEYEFYRNILELCAGREGVFPVKAIQANFGLITAYKNWLKIGGVKESLEADVVEQLDYLVENFEQDLSEQLETWKRQEKWDLVAAAQRRLAGFALQNNRPNDAVAYFKAVIETVEQNPNATVADQGSAHFELGVLFYQFKKYKAALPYFETALELYAEAGEDFEMTVIQIEALLEECRNIA